MFTHISSLCMFYVSRLYYYLTCILSVWRTSFALSIGTELGRLLKLFSVFFLFSAALFFHSFLKDSSPIYRGIGISLLLGEFCWLQFSLTWWHLVYWPYSTCHLAVVGQHKLDSIFYFLLREKIEKILS